MSDAKAPETPTIPMINLTIDDRPVSVPKGSNVIQAAKKLGIHVPHYCYHEKLTVAGNCRMCLIEMGMPKTTPDRKPVLKPDGSPEIAWIPRPAIGCATTVSEGMAIKTNSKMVEDCRKGVMEFLLINHPLDCPICDQAGECHLQEYSVEYGQANSRFVEEKVHKPKQVQLGPRVTLDDERCIMCSRCIRFCKEVAKDDVLGFTERGSHTTLACYPGKELNNNYSLNTVDICPVGALTSTDFRFKMRVWFLKETNSICTSCSTGCNIVVGSREGTVYRYTPRRNDGVNSDWMCDYGRLNYKWINDPKRLTTPTMKSGSQQVEVNWERAVEQARQALDNNRGKIAIVASGRSTTEEQYLVKKLIAEYGIKHVDIIDRRGESDNILLSADRNPNTNGARVMGLTSNQPGSKISEISQGIDRGEIKVVLTTGECLVKAGISESILSKLSSVIALDLLPNRTTEVASIVMAVTSHVEKRGTFINGKKRIQRFNQGMPTKGHARPDWEVLNELLPQSKRSFSTFEGLFKEMCQSTPALNEVTWNGLGDTGIDLSPKIS